MASAFPMWKCQNEALCQNKDGHLKYDRFCEIQTILSQKTYLSMDTTFYTLYIWNSHGYTIQYAQINDEASG